MNRRKFLQGLLGVAALAAAGPLNAWTVTTPLPKWKTVSFTITDVDLARYVANGNIDIAAGIQALADAIDRRCLELYLN